MLLPYWDFFEDAVDGDLRADREALLGQVAAMIDAEVCAADLIDGREAGVEAGERIAARRPDAIVVAMSMAVPPAFAAAALDALPSTPLVVLVLNRRSSYGPDYSHADVTADGGTVGGAQLISTLHRRRREHSVVVLALDEEEGRRRLARAVGAATAAGRMRRARVGRVGGPIDGYECVECDADALRGQLGVELVEIDAAAVREAYLAVGAGATEAVEREMRDLFELAPGLEAEAGTRRSARMAAALREIDRGLGLDAGAMNCHVPEIRFAADPGPGLAPCFALGRETSSGIPWSCTGDVPTAIAMLTTKLLGHAALYHEIEALDRATGEALLATSGEHDLGLADPARRPALALNPWWTADPCPGVCARFTVAPGPATLVAFTPHEEARGGFRYLVAEGELTERSLPGTGTANGAFRFAEATDVADAWMRWTATGVNHHSVVGGGHFGAEIAAVADHLGVECVSLSRAGRGLST